MPFLPVPRVMMWSEALAVSFLSGWCRGDAGDEGVEHDVALE
ncbi:hypothetical protein [Haloferula sp.]